MSLKVEYHENTNEWEILIKNILFLETEKYLTP